MLISIETDKWNKKWQKGTCVLCFFFFLFYIAHRDSVLSVFQTVFSKYKSTILTFRHVDWKKKRTIMKFQGGSVHELCSKSLSRLWCALLKIIIILYVNEESIQLFGGTSFIQESGKVKCFQCWCFEGPGFNRESLAGQRVMDSLRKELNPSQEI